MATTPNATSYKLDPSYEVTYLEDIEVKHLLLQEPRKRLKRY